MIKLNSLGSETRYVVCLQLTVRLVTEYVRSDVVVYLHCLRDWLRANRAVCHTYAHIHVLRMINHAVINFVNSKLNLFLVTG